MDWDANLAAIIKHTDANLKQQFRQFEEISSDLGSHSQHGVSTPRDPECGAFSASRKQPLQDASASNFASTFLRDTMATLRSSHSTTGGGGEGSAPPTSFAQHFRERQERKRYEQHNENNRMATEDGDSDHEEQTPLNRPRRSRNSAISGGGGHAGMGFHMYSSPTYDMAQMMEQVRLSLKLEVDARASIAERQLSALLQLCKASSEELDRLRVEVCAADRQLHTIDQVQAKMRQELTTQKDIGFHLQSMCGKDESWRMQAENQLLELRQMVAAIREQGNSVQMQVQEKLSRQELLVQFNAAIEPIKAQFQATLQHQAHQLAEITRTSSSSSLLLDALTQKVNRVQSDEIVALRNDLQALKIHVSRMRSFDRRTVLQADDEDAEEESDNDDGDENVLRSSRRSIKSKRAKEKEADQKRERLNQEREQRERLRDNELKKQILSELLPQAVLPIVKCEVDRSVTAPMSELKTSVGREVGQLTQDLQMLSRQIQENELRNQRRAEAIEAETTQQLKQYEQLLRGEVAAQLRDARDRTDQTTKDLATQFTTLLDTRVAAIHSKHNDVVKVMESEQKDRKTVNEALQEELRRTRYSLEEQLHALNCEARTKATTVAENWSQKLRDVEHKWNEIVETTARQQAQALDTACVKARTAWDERVERVEARTKAVEELVVNVERSVQDAITSIVKASSSKEPRSTEGEGELRPTRRSSMSDSASNSETQTQSHLAAMDALLQKMLLQMHLQLQQQQQAQAQLTMAQSAAAAVLPASLFRAPHWSTIEQAHSSAPPPPVPASIPRTLGPESAVQAMEIAQVKPPPPREETVIARETAAALAPLPAPTNAKHEPEKQAELIPDPKIDDIISRAMVEELASPSLTRSDRKSEASRPVESITPQSLPTTLAPFSSAVSVIEVARDPEAKVQQTLASTAKGAITEAEMAKLRIEARRKQEQEARQQSAASPQAGSAPAPLSPALLRSASTSSLFPGSPLPNPDGSSVQLDGKVAPLTCNNSTSNLFPLVAHVAAPPGTSVAGRPPPITIPSTSTVSTAAENKPLPESLSATTLSSAAAVVAPPPAPLIPRPGNTMTSEFQESGIVVSANEAKPRASTPPSPLLIQTATASPSSALRPPPSTTMTPPTAPPQPATVHSLCEQCRLPVRSDLLSEHMQRQCIKRTVPCTKCHVKFPWHEVEPHQRDCAGAQPTATTKAPPPAPTPPPVPAAAAAAPLAVSPNVGSESMTGEADASAVTGSQLKKCRHCTAEVAATELFEHELRCDQMLKQCPHCLRRQKMAELQDHIENCDCRLVPCPNDCGGKFLQRGIDKHLATRCPKRSSSGTASPSKASASASNTSGPAAAPPPPPPTVTASAISTPPPAAPNTSAKIECKFCDEEFSTKEIDAHENTCDWKPKRCQHCNMVIISRDLLRHESSCKTTTKNCPHCHDAMPPAALPAHTSRCSKRPIKCIRCCQLFPADSIVSHSSSCKFIPSSTHASGTLASATASASVPATASALPVRIPPPPPYPPTSTAAPANGSQPPTSSTVPPPPSGSRPPTPGQSVASAAAAKPVGSLSATTAMLEPSANVDDRLAKRNLALSQLTNQGIAAPSSATTQSSRMNGASTLSAQANPIRGPPQPQVDDEDDEDEEEDEDDDDQLTLAQVVAEWSVENVCLWLHEDVGVPEVVPRFQQRRCTGEMLLELTESDLINDYGIKNRIHRERILSAIDAIKTSDDFSDEEEDEEDEEEEKEEEGEEDDDGGDHSAMVGGRPLHAPQQRTSTSRLSLSDAVSSPRDLLRRNSLPSPQHSPVRMAGAPTSSSSTLPSSSAMLRRINSALNVEFPPSTR